jgi:hypothetical protein
MLLLFVGLVDLSDGFACHFVVAFEELEEAIVAEYVTNDIGVDQACV